MSHTEGGHWNNNLFFFFFNSQWMIFVLRVEVFMAYIDLSPVMQISCLPYSCSWRRNFLTAHLGGEEIMQILTKNNVTCCCDGAGPSCQWRKDFCIPQTEIEGIGLERTLLSPRTADQLESCWWSNNYSSQTIYPLEQFFGFLPLNHFKWLTDLICGDCGILQIVLTCLVIYPKKK